jgi:hypothetical protein
MGLGERRLQGIMWRQRHHRRLPGHHRTELSPRAPCIQRHHPRGGEAPRHQPQSSRSRAEEGKPISALPAGQFTGGGRCRGWGADGRRPTRANSTLHHVLGWLELRPHLADLVKRAGGARLTTACDIGTSRLARARHLELQAGGRPWPSPRPHPAPGAAPPRVPAPDNQICPEAP